MIRVYLAIIMLSIASVSAYGNTRTTTIKDNPKQTIEEIEKATGDMSEPHHIIISKESMLLKLYDRDSLLICSFPVAMGKHYGDKQELGDCKTPEGEFSIVQIQRASHWMYNTAKESIKGYYGNWFIRLNTKYSGIGIHGTHEPEKIGQRTTEGSIRLDNYHLDSLRTMIDVGMIVRIESSRLDREADGKSPEPEDKAPEQTILPIANDNASPVIEEHNNTESAEKSITTKPSDDSNTEPATKSEDKDTEEVTPKPREQRAASDDVEEVWHTIQEGELVGRIAKKYGISLAEIKRLNPNINVDKVSIGQRIKVKGKATQPTDTPSKKATSTTTNGKEVWHTVASGDLVGRIATQYGTTVKHIEELNPGLDPDRISIGQKIRVK